MATAAMIVPTFRRVAHLKQAAAAARSLACLLVTLHSGIWTSDLEAAAFVDPRRGSGGAVPAHLRYGGRYQLLREPVLIGLRG